MHGDKRTNYRDIKIRGLIVSLFIRLLKLTVLQKRMAIYSLLFIKFPFAFRQRITIETLPFSDYLLIKGFDRDLFEGLIRLLDKDLFEGLIQVQELV